MKRSNDLPLKDAINELLDSLHLKEKVNEKRLIQNYEKIFGKTMAKYTTKIFVKDKKLYLTLDSSSLRQELQYNKDKLIQRINEEITTGFITEVILR